MYEVADCSYSASPHDNRAGAVDLRDQRGVVVVSREHLICEGCGAVFDYVAPFLAHRDQCELYREKIKVLRGKKAKKEKVK